MHDGTLYRTQIQLTGAQVTALKAVAARRGVSMAAVIRDVVDELVARGVASDGNRTRARALAAVGRFRSGRRDVSRRHDDYLSEAFDR
jgi:predicted DNA-binding ribbon-helix-helix protein